MSGVRFLGGAKLLVPVDVAYYILRATRIRILVYTSFLINTRDANDRVATCIASWEFFGILYFDSTVYESLLQFCDLNFYSGLILLGSEIESRPVFPNHNTNSLCALNLFDPNFTLICVQRAMATSTVGSTIIAIHVIGIIVILITIIGCISALIRALIVWPNRSVLNFVPIVIRFRSSFLFCVHFRWPTCSRRAFIRIIHLEDPCHGNIRVNTIRKISGKERKGPVPGHLYHQHPTFAQDFSPEIDWRTAYISHAPEISMQPTTYCFKTSCIELTSISETDDSRKLLLAGIPILVFWPRMIILKPRGHLSITAEGLSSERASHVLRYRSIYTVMYGNTDVS